MEFKNWIISEARGQVAYHVTLAKYMPNIALDGIVPNSSKSNFPGYGGHSGDKNFFSSTLKNAGDWIDKLKAIIDNDYEPGAWVRNNFVNNKSIPIIIKFRFNRTKGSQRWHNDLLAGEDDFHTHQPIPAIGLKMWNGNQWSDLSQPLDYSKFIETEAVHPDDWDESIPADKQFYWAWKEPYPMPSNY